MLENGLAQPLLNRLLKLTYSARTKEADRHQLCLMRDPPSSAEADRDQLRLSSTQKIGRRVPSMCSENLSRC